MIGTLRPRHYKWHIFNHLEREVGNVVPPTAAGGKRVGEQCTVAKCGEALPWIAGNGIEVRYLIKGFYLVHTEYDVPGDRLL